MLHIQPFATQQADDVQPASPRQALALIGHEVTLLDDKARKELGYTSHMSVDEGMQEITVPKKKR